MKLNVYAIFVDICVRDSRYHSYLQSNNYNISCHWLIFHYIVLKIQNCCVVTANQRAPLEIKIAVIMFDEIMSGSIKF